MQSVAPGRELAVRVDGTYWDADTQQDWGIWQARAAEARRLALLEAARLCDAADKSTHPSDLADKLRALADKQKP